MMRDRNSTNLMTIEKLRNFICCSAHSRLTREWFLFNFPLLKVDIMLIEMLKVSIVTWHIVKVFYSD